MVINFPKNPQWAFSNMRSYWYKNGMYFVKSKKILIKKKYRMI